MTVEKMVKTDHTEITMKKTLENLKKILEGGKKKSFVKESHEEKRTRDEEKKKNVERTKEDERK